VLRDHLVRGYSTNERRLAELRRSLRLVEHALEASAVSADEATALLRVTARATQAGLAVGITYDEARGIIGRLREKFGASQTTRWQESPCSSQ
jgi:hypothetical protein